MIANTKQIRKVINQAFMTVGATRRQTWTDMPANQPNNTRYVGYEISESVAEKVAAEVRRAAKNLGYTNEIRTTDSADKQPGFYRSGACYLRVTSFLS